MWAILGGHGQLGRAFSDGLSLSNVEHMVFGRTDLDITNLSSVSDCILTTKPSVIVNCAAWTAVDQAEDHPSEAFLINELGARNIAKVARAVGARLVHISTDYVFPGVEDGPYFELAPTGPTSVYGSSKLAGEISVLAEHPENSLVVRTAWLYSQYGSNFVKTMIRKALSGSAVQVVNDQTGQPTNAIDLVDHIVQLVGTEAALGIFHGTNSGSATWFDLTLAIYELLGVDISLVTAVDSSAYPTKARRPRNSVLGHQRTLDLAIPEMRPWNESLTASINDIVSVVRKELEDES